MNGGDPAGGKAAGARHRSPARGFRDRLRGGSGRRGCRGWFLRTRDTGNTDSEQRRDE